jgi:hypothetical protein
MTFRINLLPSFSGYSFDTDMAEADYSDTYFQKELYGVTPQNA